MVCDSSIKFKEAVKQLKDLVDKKEGLRLVIRGSHNYDSRKLEEWSDIDATFVKDRGNDSIKVIRQIYNKFNERYPSIRLAVTVVDEEDNMEDNAFHHHGVKPVAYNYEIAQQIEKDGFEEIPHNLREDLIRISSVYRYYQILHSFRRTLATLDRPPSPRVVSKALHRASRLLRTQLEIDNPSLVKKEGKIHEQEHVSDLVTPERASSFFAFYSNTKENWENIREKPDRLDEIMEQIADTIEHFHHGFLPKLKEIGERYSE